VSHIDRFVHYSVAKQRNSNAHRPFLYYKTGSRGSCVGGIATGWKAGVRFLAGQYIFSSLLSDRLWCSPSLKWVPGHVAHSRGESSSAMKRTTHTYTSMCLHGMLLNLLGTGRTSIRRPCRYGTRPEDDKLSKLERWKDSALCGVAHESHSAPYFVLLVLPVRLRNVSFRFGACWAV
jgi:hypothetical protein